MSVWKCHNHTENMITWSFMGFFLASCMHQRGHYISCAVFLLNWGPFGCKYSIGLDNLIFCPVFNCTLKLQYNKLHIVYIHPLAWICKNNSWAVYHLMRLIKRGKVIYKHHKHHHQQSNIKERTTTSIVEHKRCYDKPWSSGLPFVVIKAQLLLLSLWFLLRCWLAQPQARYCFKVDSSLTKVTSTAEGTYSSERKEGLG